MAKESFAPSVWDRLMAASETDSTTAGYARLTLDQLKASVARDLEDLLNTRVALHHGTLAMFPACRKSILNYGLVDFAALCLTSSEDRKVICDSIKEAIDRFEPRLSNVSADIFIERGATNRLDFVIAGTLKAHTSAQRIEFSAMLQPSTLRYSISQMAQRLRTGRATAQ